MFNRDRVFSHVQGNPGQCDDCISTQLDIRPRMQVNQICNSLSEEGCLGRQRSVCTSCNDDRMCNFC